MYRCGLIFCFYNLLWVCFLNFPTISNHDAYLILPTKRKLSNLLLIPWIWKVYLFRIKGFESKFHRHHWHYRWLCMWGIVKTLVSCRMANALSSCNSTTGTGDIISTTERLKQELEVTTQRQEIVSCFLRDYQLSNEEVLACSQNTRPILFIVFQILADLYYWLVDPIW